MKCIHPVTRKYRDIAGIEHSYSCPCGKCVACQHNFQDSWTIRMLEETKANPHLIFETLTFKPESLPMVDMTDIISGSENKIPEDYMSHIDKYLSVDKETGEFRYMIPLVEKSLIQNWIKRGREKYFKDTGKRLNFKYFITMEFGPTTSRPHFHGIFWNISPDVYQEYFGKPWQEQYGFTKTTVKGYDGNISGKDAWNMCGYIAKYCSKGVFESPLVKLNLIPKPFRCVSKGIGEAYLDNPIFDYYKSAAAQFAKSIAVEDIIVSPKVKCPLNKSCALNGTRIKYRDYRRVRNAIECNLMDGWLKAPTESELRALTTYMHNGYMHALPRYYKTKLLNLFKPNLFSYEIQSLLLESTRLLNNTKLQEFAHSLGHKVKWEKVADAFAGFGRKLYNLLSVEFTIRQKDEAWASAKRCYSNLKNQYNRSRFIPALS